MKFLILAMILNTAYANFEELEGMELFQVESPVITSEKIQEKSNALPIDLDHLEAEHFLDIRGFGDSGWSWTHQSPPIDPEFGSALDRFSKSGKLYRGDINFINWESVIGTQCEQWHAPYRRGRSYAFLSRTENIEQALERGIEFFALSNNHTRDCHQVSEEISWGQIATLQELEMLNHNYSNLIYHGVDFSNKNKPRIVSKIIKGKEVKIAFSSLYIGRESCPYAVCLEDSNEILSEMKKARADLKILMIHSMSDQTKLVEVAKRFINESDGDIVFGSGPHRWKPIRLIKKDNQNFGIIFDSLGNFLHPSMAPRGKNIIGRVLFDLSSLKIKQIQLIPVKNNLLDVELSEENPSSIESNVNWNSFQINDSQGKSFNGAYFNL